MHSYDVSDKKSPYPSECFDIGLCGLLALKQPHKHHKDDDGCTTYQVKVDIPIAHNEKNGKLDCDVITAVLEEWNLDNSYIHFVTIHFSTSFNFYHSFFQSVTFDLFLNFFSSETVPLQISWGCWNQFIKRLICCILFYL